MHKKLLFAGVTALLWSVAITGKAQENPEQFRQKYPSKPIRVLVGQAPGGGVDTVSRVIAQRLTERLGHPVVVDNRAGAAGTIAASMAAQAQPDGYTLLVISTGTLVTSMLMKKLNYDIRKAYVPVALLLSQPYLLVVNAQLPVNSVKELIVYAKAKPGTLNYASTGIGSTSHLGTELFKSITSIEMVHVAYKGVGPALADLISGQIQLSFATVVSVLPNVKAGKVKALAIAAGKRMQTLPDLPTVTESGVAGYELSVAYGMFAPAGTPAAVVSLLNKQAINIMSSANMKEKLAADGSEAPSPHSPTQFSELMQRDITNWDKFFKTTTVKFE